ncbi:MAG TPA: hypothetical protein ENK49_04850 [Gammaproteobacteria bacterium]|nr:hypothetical protein [Gammaproteobacteria bacterium]
MKRSTRAALLSAFIFPGAGHLYLKKYLAGAVLAGISLTAMYRVVSDTIGKAYQISEQLLNGAAPLDAGAISELVAGQTTGSEARSMNMAMAAFIICWLIGIVDSYRAGRVPVDGRQ